MHVVKIRYAIQCYIVAYQSPRYRTWLAVVQRVERVRKMRNMTSAGVDRPVEDFGLRLRVANKCAHSPL